MKVINLYTSFSNYGGAQNVSITLYQEFYKINEIKHSLIASFTSYNEIEENYKKKIRKEDYFKVTPQKLYKYRKEYIFISHHRKITTLLYLLPFKFKIIHVAHNEFTNLKCLTFFPKHIVAVSKAVKENHRTYFGLKNIQVIYNGICQKTVTKKRKFTNKNVRILYPGRVNTVKQQVEIVKYLKNKIPNNITLVFAGTGNLLTELKQLTKGDNRFKTLGFVTNMEQQYLNSDFVMLFSKKEGLPLSLIEATQMGLPIICNNVGGNLEILQVDKNGFLISSFKEIETCFKNISNISVSNYAYLSSNATKIYKEKFSLEKMISEYLNLIRSVN